MTEKELNVIAAYNTLVDFFGDRDCENCILERFDSCTGIVPSEWKRIGDKEIERG